MQVVCDIIHHRSKNVPMKLPPSQMHRVALLTDKYDCTAPTSFAMRAWLQPTALVST
jgi:hypothetical protein